MAKNRTLKSRFTSKYGGGSISAAQLLTELICENKARCTRRTLFNRFWEDEEWSKFFRQQIPSATQLLKYYDVLDIVQAIKNQPRTYSLRSPFLIKEIKRLSKKKTSETDLKTNPELSQKEPRKKTGSKTVIGLLEELDGNE